MDPMQSSSRNTESMSARQFSVRKRLGDTNASILLSLPPPQQLSYSATKLPDTCSDGRSRETALIKETIKLLETKEREKIELIERKEAEKLALLEQKEAEKLKIVEKKEAEKQELILKLIDKRETSSMSFLWFF
ncbi:7106_t:CDS:2 [Gigaspora margarita]|uniref:7106_t:CDS:1 n=1 Tax=Gigaspora margarita TaxID=4874 RepID=A0ABN7V3T8_GIGMA|nr:7106_t:CDS:2 [Gigaspora margarita]